MISGSMSVHFNKKKQELSSDDRMKAPVNKMFYLIKKNPKCT